MAINLKDSQMYPITEIEELIVNLYAWTFQNHSGNKLAVVGKSL